MNNAILLAGGVGNRMAPIPRCNKSLLTIRGEINLIRIIKLLRDREIEDIVIAANPGAYREILSEVVRAFPNPPDRERIKIIPVEEYTVGCNTVVTLRAVLDEIKDSYIIETDQYYVADNIDFFRKEPYEDSLVFTQMRSEEDWGVLLQDTGYVECIIPSNPKSAYHCLSGIFYVTGTARDHLKERLRNSTNTDIYWEELLLDAKGKSIRDVYYPEGYSVEFDNISELIHKNLMQPDDIANLIDENQLASRLGSMTNTTYKVSIGGEHYALRLPKPGTNQFVNHKRESIVESCTPSFLRPTSRYYSNYEVKLTNFLKGYHVLDSMKDFDSVLTQLRFIHESSVLSKEVQEKRDSSLEIDLLKEIEDYRRVYEGRVGDYEGQSEAYKSVEAFLNQWFREHPRVLCHRDLVPLNIMINDEKDVKFIDWEYAGLLSNYWDIASFCCEFADEYQEDLEGVVAFAIEYYPAELDKKAVYQWIAVVDFVWAVWSLVYYVMNNEFYNYGLRRFRRSQEFIRKYMNSKER